MAKSKRKRHLVQDKDVHNKEFAIRVAQIIQETDNPDMGSGLVDPDYMFQPSRMARVIETRFKQKETPEDIAHYHADILTDVLTHLRVPGRSKATAKIDKAELLYDFLMKRKKFDKERKKYREENPIFRAPTEKQLEARKKKEKEERVANSPKWTRPVKRKQED